MNYAVIKDRLVADLKTIQGIGVVFDRPKYSTDWKSFFDLNAVPNPNDRSKGMINVAWITRPQVREKTINDETMAPVTGERFETWRITLIMGWTDDETAPSEYAFQTLIDTIQQKWRLVDPAGLPDSVINTEPVQLESAGFFMFGDVLVHKAELSIQIEQYTYTP